MNRLARKLEGCCPLDAEDKRVLDEVIARARTVPARTNLIAEGESPENVHLMLDGFACRYKLTQGGKRQIMAYLVPGDFCDLHVAVLREMDHSIGTLSDARVVDIPRRDVDKLLNRPNLAKALWWATLVDEAILREWLVNIGAREAPTAVAHLLAELLARLRAVGLAAENTYELPITQEELGDTIGISTVHVSRSLKALREEGLVTFRNKRVVIADAERLFEYSGFNPNYLHLARAARERA
jgi:CRP-like cAMP-binding protein